MRFCWLPIIAIAAIAMAGCGATIGSGSPGAGNAKTPPPAFQPTGPSGPTTPISPPGPPTLPVTLPADLEIDAAPGGAVWALLADRFLFRSTDRASTWVQRSLPTLIGRPQMSFINSTEGWLNAGGSPATQCTSEMVALYHTLDGGESWSRLGAAGIGDAMCKEDISFLDASRGFLSAWDDNHSPVIYWTMDGGASWSASPPLPDPLGFVTQGGGYTLHPGRVAAMAGELLVPAWSGQGKGYVFRSLDGGRSWQPLVQEPGVGWSNPALITATRWLVISPNAMQETTDAGASWHAYPSNYSQAAPLAPSLAFGDRLTGYATVRGQLARTLDGGQHWTFIKTPGTG